MIRYDRGFRILAVSIAGMAGYVDAIGFLKLGGLFVSFMSGNSTHLAIGAVTDPAVVFAAGPLILAFLVGVLAGTIISSVASIRRKPVVLGCVGILLIVATVSDRTAPDWWTTMIMAMAMGVTNTVFQREGKVSIGVTYMTGTLVKLGQHLADALLGGRPWDWLPYLALWFGLIGGAAAGARAYLRFGAASIAAMAFVVFVLAVYAAMLGPAEPIGRAKGRRDRRMDESAHP